MPCKDKIYKTMSIQEIIYVLDYHQIKRWDFWEYVLWGLLQECDYLEVIGFGTNAKFVQKKELKK